MTNVRWIKFLGYQLLAIALFYSWISPQTRPLWDALDVALFRTLNDSLRESPFWQQVVGLFALRKTDILFDFIMFTVTLSYVLWNKGERKMRLIQMVFMTLYILGVIELLKHAIHHFGSSVHFRNSPTLALDNTLRLSHVLGNPKIRDHSSCSFPGDHALSFFLWASLVYGFCGWKRGVLAWVFAILFCLPRLFGGAHWFTDDFIGSGSVTLIASAWLFGTPLSQWITKLSSFRLRKADA